MTWVSATGRIYAFNTLMNKIRLEEESFFLSQSKLISGSK